MSFMAKLKVLRRHKRQQKMLTLSLEWRERRSLLLKMIN